MTHPISEAFNSFLKKSNKTPLHSGQNALTNKLINKGQIMVETINLNPIQIAINGVLMTPIQAHNNLSEEIERIKINLDKLVEVRDAVAKLITLR
jgi:hypothetical protein